jgi:hypothetical protein
MRWAGLPSKESYKILEILLWYETEAVVREDRQRTVNHDKSVNLFVLRRLQFTVHEMIDKINTVKYYCEIDLCRILLN